MQTLTLNEAAALLGLHPNTLQARAKSGHIPGAKIGKEWRFLEVDLIECLRAHYPANQQPVAKLCRSISVEKRGTSTSSILKDTYAEALGRPTKRKLSASMTN